MQKPQHFRRSMAEIGVIAAFLLAPVWLRFGDFLPFFSRLYVTRFVLFIPLIWTIFWWLLAGAPGIRKFAESKLRALWLGVLLLLVIWSFLSQSWAFVRVQHPEVAATAALQFGTAILFAAALACLQVPPAKVISALVFGLVWNSLLTLLQARAGGAIGLTALGEFPYNALTPGISIVRAGEITFVRPFGLLPHVNLLAGFLMVSLLAAASWLVSERRWRRILATCILPLGLYALLLTFSRAAWGGVFFGGCLLLLFGWRKLRQRQMLILAAITVAICVIVTIVFVSQYGDLLSARVGTGEEGIEMRSISDRIVFMEYALKAIGQAPLTGFGIGNFPWRASFYLQFTFYDLRGDNVHHVFLLAWSELGTPGMIMLGIAVLSGFFAAVRMIRATHNMYRIALASTFVALAAVGWLDHYPYTLLHFQVLWWGCIAAALSPPRNPALSATPADLSPNTLTEAKIPV